jgi:hypothetical protein
MAKRAKPSKPAGRERRRSARHTCRLMATCRLTGVGKKKPATARIVDISTGGIGLLLDRTFDPGTSFDVELRTAAGERTLPAEVIHSAQLAPGLWMIGAAFATHLGADELQSLLS